MLHSYDLEVEADARKLLQHQRFYVLTPLLLRDKPRLEAL